ncbi:MAG: hypothetical protein OEV66_02910 [Spirochaetia bacterium]|nr:hypothetical protein [Spirochaetia bacterium]
MKKTLIVLFFSASLNAASWDADYTVQSSQKEGDVTTDVLQDKAGVNVTVSYSGDLQENMISYVKKVNADFQSWKSLKLESIKVSFSDGDTQILVIPKSFSYNETNFMDYLPSGILFSYRAELVYNFRIMIGKLFVPIKGIFLDERSFNEKILSAIKDPVTYINARDPEYILEKLERVSTDLERLRAAYLAQLNGNRLIDKNLIQEIIDIKSRNPNFTNKEIEREVRDKKIKAGGGLIKDILRIYFNEFY